MKTVLVLLVAAFSHQKRKVMYDAFHFKRYILYQTNHIWKEKRTPLFTTAKWWATNSRRSCFEKSWTLLKWCAFLAPKTQKHFVLLLLQISDFGGSPNGFEAVKVPKIWFFVTHKSVKTSLFCCFQLFYVRWLSEILKKKNFGGMVGSALIRRRMIKL